MPISRLVPEMKELFLKIHAKRLSSMGSDERDNNSLNNIKDIKINQKETCFEVYFKNGEWYKYFPDMTWG